MASGNPYTIHSMPEGHENELGIHPSSAGNTHDPDVRRILEPAHSSQVGRSITAPIAEKSCYFRFPLGHERNSSRCAEGCAVGNIGGDKNPHKCDSESEFPRFYMASIME
jgi:hypothetical protein